MVLCVPLSEELVESFGTSTPWCPVSKGKPTNVLHRKHPGPFNSYDSKPIIFHKPDRFAIFGMILLVPSQGHHPGVLQNMDP